MMEYNIKTKIPTIPLPNVLEAAVIGDEIVMVMRKDGSFLGSKR